jgi:3-oxoacyl-[acyl-carrier-protein] synthase II
MTAYAVSLALQDAGIEYSPLRKQNIGVVGTNAEGSLQSDQEYFRDYLEGGRTLSRGNLFIYTLPSSPIGEAAIHFGLLGPVVYAASEDNALAAVLDAAGEMLLANEAPVMLVGKAEADEALFFVIARLSGPDQPALCNFSEARTLVETNPDLSGLIQKFLRMAARKGSL